MPTALTDLEPDLNTKIAILSKLANDYLRLRYELTATYGIQEKYVKDAGAMTELQRQLGLCQLALSELDSQIRELVEQARAGNQGGGVEQHSPQSAGQSTQEKKAG